VTILNAKGELQGIRIYNMDNLEDPQQFNLHGPSLSFTKDKIVDSVLHKFIIRSNEGMQKYGQSMEREDISPKEWANHLLEELMDASLYLQRLKQDLPMKATMVEQVEEFIKVFEPTVEPFKLVGEELKEWLDSRCMVHRSVTIAKPDGSLAITEGMGADLHKYDEAHEFKEWCDLIYVLIYYALGKQWDIEKGFSLVHKSNMSKLGDDGKPIRDENGKVSKGPNYIPADLTDAIGKNNPENKPKEA